MDLTRQKLRKMKQTVWARETQFRIPWRDINTYNMFIYILSVCVASQHKYYFRLFSRLVQYRPDEMTYVWSMMYDIYEYIHVIDFVIYESFFVPIIRRAYLIFCEHFSNKKSRLECVVYNAILSTIIVQLTMPLNFSSYSNFWTDQILCACLFIAVHDQWSKIFFCPASADTLQSQWIHRSWCAYRYILTCMMCCGLADNCIC